MCISVRAIAHSYFQLSTSTCLCDLIRKLISNQLTYNSILKFLRLLTLEPVVPYVLSPEFDIDLNVQPLKRALWFCLRQAVRRRSSSASNKETGDCAWGLSKILTAVLSVYIKNPLSAYVLIEVIRIFNLFLFLLHETWVS